jgi:hypothetical protein
MTATVKKEIRHTGGFFVNTLAKVYLKGFGVEILQPSQGLIC